MTNTRPSVVPTQFLVGFDFSPLAELALGQAAFLASQRPAADIHIVNAVETARDRISHARNEDIGFEVGERLRALAASALRKVEAGSNVRVFVHVTHGDPAGEILALAEDVQADLILVGTHGRHGLKRLLMGSVAERVVRNATCPVLVMRPRSYDASRQQAPEPPCPDCLEVREASSGAEMWCAPHSKAWVRPHRYSYRDGDLHPYHPDGIGPV